MESLKTRQNSKLLAAAYILCYATTAVVDRMYLSGTGKAISVLMLGLAILLALIYPGQGRGTFKGTAVYAGWLLILLCWSLAVWIVNMEGTDVIMRGLEKLSFQALMVANVWAAAWLFGEKGISYTFYGLALGNAAMAVMYIPRYGAHAALLSFLSFAQDPSVATGYMKALEIHDITFTYGFFAIYFLFFDRADGKAKRAACLILCSALFFIGFKRSALIGFLVALVFGLALWKMPEKGQKITMGAAVCLMALLPVLYVCSIKSGAFITAMETLGVDVLGRNVLYDAISPYYELKPSFMGRGFEYVHTIMLDLAKSGDRAFNGMVDIHNDFLRVYIEMGFTGSILWAAYTFIIQYWYFKKGHGMDTARLFFLCEIYIFTTYLTDNTLFYFFTGMALRMVPLCYAAGGENGKRPKKENKKR